MSAARTGLATNDYQQCVKEYSDAITRYRADISGAQPVGVVPLTSAGDAAPWSSCGRSSRSCRATSCFATTSRFYLNYASDFQQAEQEARAVKGSDAYAMLAIAFAQLGQGQGAEAKQTYRRSPESGGSASRCRLPGSATSQRTRVVTATRSGSCAPRWPRTWPLKTPIPLPPSWTSIASAELARGRNAAAIEAAEEALKHGHDIRTRFLAARTPSAEAGDPDRARPLVEALDNEYYEEPRAYAKIVQGVLALKRGDARRAVISLREANQLFETWLGLFDLGRASLEAACTLRRIPPSTRASTPGVARRCRSSSTSSRPTRTWRRCTITSVAHGRN